MINIYKIFSEWNNNNWIIKQRTLDNKLYNLECYDTVSKYLLLIRENARKQKERLNETSIVDYPKVIEDITKENENIIQDLNKYMSDLNPCHSLKEWIDKKI
jgi:hypothetical protein